MNSIAVFMTQGMSLEYWRKSGVLPREIALYREHAVGGVRTVLVTYGGRADEEIAREYPFLTVVANRAALPRRLYAAALPLLAAKSLVGVDLVKTNQLRGARQAVRAARLAGLPVVVRQGYSLVEHTIHARGSQSRHVKKALAYERRWLRAADLCQFSSEKIKEDCTRRAQIDNKKTLVVPNYIVNDLWAAEFSNFRDITEVRPFRLCSWGRLAQQKNLQSLIAACSGLDVELVLAGDGPLRAELEVQAREQHAKVEFLGQVPHDQIAGRMADCDAFIIASHLEGHPKALIEAMCFGMPIIAADSPGITPFVTNGETALVSQTATAALRAAIEAMCSLSPDTRRRLAANARQFAINNYSLPAVSRRELAAYSDLLRSRDSRPLE